jgi:glutathione S-transferase
MHKPYTLVIGNKSYSSWSLRAWLALKHFNIPFQENLILLGQEDTAANIKQVSPSGWVPLLIDGDFRVWDSLAICEYLADSFPEKIMWPQDIKTRAHARSISHEIHSGFAALRQHLPMKCHFKTTKFDYSAAAENIERIQTLWSECLNAHQHQGPYLFGQFSIADCMYAPVVLRFRSYGVPVSGINQRYYETMLANPALQTWLADAAKETWRLERYENLTA